MGKLSAAMRKRLPSSTFVFPEQRKFPIPDRSHAANAKARAAHIGGEVEAKVDAAVARRYPGMGEEKKHKGLRGAMERGRGR